jgi:hypothetical protein
MSRHAIFVVNASRAEAVAATKEISQILLKDGFTLSTPSDISIFQRLKLYWFLGEMAPSFAVLKSRAAKIFQYLVSILVMLDLWQKLKSQRSLRLQPAL